MSKNSEIFDLIIIGAGPTGISIGIEAKKAGLSYLILEKGMLVNSIYNFPTNMTFFSTSTKLEIGNTPFISHSDKPTRKEALEYYRRIQESFQIPIKYKTEVHSLSKENELFKIFTNNENYIAQNVAVATGFYDIPKPLDVLGEELPKVKHYYDDAHPYIGMNVLVIGGANSACDVALETWQKGAKVTMVVRENTLYQKVKYWILPNIENRIKEGSIKAHFNSKVVEIREKEVDILTPDGPLTLVNDYVLAMTGYLPDFDFLQKLGLKLEGEFQIPKHNPESLESNLANLYVAGVINAGSQTSKLFIENTRHHGSKIVKDILSKKN